MSANQTDALVRATAKFVREEVEGVADAAATLIGETRKQLAAEIENKTTALAAVAAAASANAAAAVAPAVAAAEARRAALLRRRADTLATVRHWLRECVDAE